MDGTENTFTAYEYLTITVKDRMEQVYIDCYRHFGWVAEKEQEQNGSGTVVLKLKRDRKIKNREDLTRLQKKCEAAFKAIERLEGKQGMRAIMLAISVGLAGTAFIVGAVFSYMAGNIPLCVILLIPGVSGWRIPLPLYMNINNRQNEQIERSVDEQYDILYSACDEANALNC
ncbi:MAG: hypothetical protein LBL09_02550 [Oscillospiraceae bacterium]|nr:hypothetical protein [Oscillospiraceae bacterium]